jgi:hypothetical protein
MTVDFLVTLARGHRDVGARGSGSDRRGDPRTSGAWDELFLPFVPAFLLPRAAPSRRAGEWCWSRERR